MTLWIFTQQKASLPSWVPVVGEEFDHITGEFTTAQAVTPGPGPGGRRRRHPDRQGHLGRPRRRPRRRRHGHRAQVHGADPPRRQPAAAAENQPQRHGRRGRSRQRQGPHRGRPQLPALATEPNVNLDAFLATLDADTRQYIQLLVAGGAQGIGGRGRQLGNALRRLQPFSHYIADLNRAVAQRREALAHVIHDFGLLTTELGRHDVRDRTLGHLLQGRRSATSPTSSSSIQEILTEFPSTLSAAESAFASADRFSKTARPALLGLIPQAQALKPALKANQRLFEQTVEPIRTQIRPFTREIRPVLTHAKRGLGRLQQVGAQLRQRARRLQQLPQRARLQAEGLEAELPLLPALAQPQHQRDLQPRAIRPGRSAAA